MSSNYTVNVTLTAEELSNIRLALMLRAEHRHQKSKEYGHNQELSQEFMAKSELCDRLEERLGDLQRAAMKGEAA